MKKLLMTLAIAALAVPTFAQTAPSRVGVFNVQKVLADSTAGKASYDKLKKVQDEKTAQAKKMDDELKALDQQINNRSLSLSQDKIADLQKQFTDKKVALQRFAQDADREIGQARDRELAELERQLLPVINEIGKEMGFAAIFNRSDSGIVYASDAIDITDTITKRFNEATAKGGAAAPKK